MALNEGVTSGSTVTLNVVTAAHWPASGVKVYVVVPGVEVLMVDDHEPLKGWRDQVCHCYRQGGGCSALARSRCKCISSRRRIADSSWTPCTGNIIR